MYFYTALPFHIFKDTEVNELDRCRMSRLRIFPGVHHAAQVYNIVCEFTLYTHTHTKVCKEMIYEYTCRGKGCSGDLSSQSRAISGAD